MRLDPRILLPAAAVAAAVALPTSASADPTGMCPDHFTPTFIFAAPPGAEQKDHNGNLIVCHKDVPGQGDPTKDDRGIITGGLDDNNLNNFDDDFGP
jgi:hypothetical protein